MIVNRINIWNTNFYIVIAINQLLNSVVHERLIQVDLSSQWKLPLLTRLKNSNQICYVGGCKKDILSNGKYIHHFTQPRNL